MRLRPIAESAIPQAQAAGGRVGAGCHAVQPTRIWPSPEATPRPFGRLIENIAPIPWWFASGFTEMRWNRRSLPRARFDGCRRRSGGSYHGFRISIAPPAAGQSAIPLNSSSSGRRTAKRRTKTIHERSCDPQSDNPGQRGMPGTLAPEERRRISVRLGAGLVGIGLLGLGTLLVRLEPDQWQIGELFRGLAAAVVGIPTLVSGLRGIVTGDTRRATDQLVAIAVLAAAATGDFVTATLIPLFLELGRLFEERSSLGARAAIDGIRALAARQAVTLAQRCRGARRSEQLWFRETKFSCGPARESRWTEPCLKDGPRSINPPSPGESLHEDVGPGSPVFAGTVAMDGLLKIQVRGAGADTVLGRVVQLLADVERTSVPLLRLFERRAGVWLPLVLTRGGDYAVFHQ